MPHIKRDDLLRTHPFGKRYHAGIHTAEWQIRVPLHEVRGSRQVIQEQLGDTKESGPKRSQERCLDGGPGVAPEQVAHLGHHRW